MKKKILLTITFIIMIIFIPCVRAEGNMKVIFNTSFEEQIDINKIDKIFIMMDDSDLKDYEIVLNHNENFRFELDNLPQGDIVINSITVSRDYTVEYDYQYAITKNSEEEMIVSLLVTKVSKDPNRKKVEVTNEYIAEVLGYDPLKFITDDQDTSDSTTNQTTTTPTNSDEPVVITSSSSTTNTIDNSKIEEIEKEKQEEEKKQEQEKRKNIYLMILLVVIAALIIIGVLVGIKIANANK